MDELPIFQMIMPLAFVAFAIVAFVYMRRFGRASSEKAIVEAVPMMRVFFERTGYAHAQSRGASVEAQITRWQQVYAASMRGEGYDVHMVRDFHGLEVHWEQFTGQRDNAYVMSASWWAPMARMPRTVFHIAESGLASATSKLAKEMFTNVTTNWKPAFAKQIKTGDRDIDGRFVVYGEHEEAVSAVLAEPALKQALLACAYVDLRVTPDSVRMSDPQQKNTLAMMGGTYGAMQYAGNPGKAFEVTLPVHDRIATILYTAASRAA
ncbi:MAG: hypothetical protein ACXVEE_35110 [Polyangiales bacterium]